jgi:glycerol-3-phosphate dehydrogenase
MKRNVAQLTSQTYDVLVIGGGIYGACVAWDAALRGLSVALVEKGDFGAATSANSLKIIHGGLRYLQDGNLRLVRQMSRGARKTASVSPISWRRRS